MKLLKIFILCAIGTFYFGTYSFANNTDIEEIAEVAKTDVLSEEEPAFVVVEQMPSFPGGNAEMKKFLTTNLKYPAEIAEIDIQGRVIVSFIVEKNGELSNIEVIKGVDKYLDAEAVKVIKSMPQWIPGKHNGREVRVKFLLPIRFEFR